MVGTGANRMPLTKIHPILLGKQKSEGTSLLARHRQQFEERRQDNQAPKHQMPMGGGSGGPHPPSQNPQMRMPPPLPRPSHPQQSRQQPSYQQPSYQQPSYQQPPHQPPSHQPPPHQPPPHQQHGHGMRQPAPLPAVTYPPPPNMYQGPPPPLPYPMPLPQGQVPPQPPPPAYAPRPAQPPPPMDSGPSPPKPNSDTRTKSEPKGGTDVGISDGNAAPVKKKRKSRWGAVEDKAVLTGPMTTLPANLTEEQRKQYLIQFKIEEITQKLRTGELGIPVDPGDRSPSPEPIYNSEGKRLNTREFRVRKQLEEERHSLIKQAIEEVPNYKPPIDYKPPASKICDKVFIPAERNPAVNFIGLLIGPRGNTLKRLEKETGCKIIIRGKGSVKEGKVGRIPGQLMPGEDEPLHALITGPSEEEVKKGVQVVGDIVKEGIECPDAANELRRNQLRELAELNGTLIDDEVIKCKNCGLTDHRHWECTERKNVTSEISCTKCGGYGHVAVDCKVKVEANAAPAQTFAEKAKMDTEYMSLMAELGVDAPPPPPKEASQENSSSSDSTSASTSAQTSSSASGSTSTPLLPAPSTVAILPPPNAKRMPAPNMNVPPPNMNVPPPNTSGPPMGSSNARGGRGGNSNKWGPPPASSAPQSLMDVNLGPNIGNMGMSNQNKFGGPRGDGMHRPRPHGMSGPRPDGPQGMPPPSWRNRGGPDESRRGGNAIPPWQQQGQGRGPPPNSNFAPPSSNEGYGPPPSNSDYGPPSYNPRMDHPSVSSTPNQRAPPSNQSVTYPTNRWSQPDNSNDNQMPPNSFANIPPHWATQPPPPPPPE